MEQLTEHDCIIGTATKKYVNNEEGRYLQLYYGNNKNYNYILLITYIRMRQLNTHNLICCKEDKGNSAILHIDNNEEQRA